MSANAGISTGTRRSLPKRHGLRSWSSNLGAPTMRCKYMYMHVPNVRVGLLLVPVLVLQMQTPQVRMRVRIFDFACVLLSSRDHAGRVPLR